MDKCWQNCTSLDKLEQVWESLDKFEQFGNFEQVLTRMDMFLKVWKNLEMFRLYDLLSEKMGYNNTTKVEHCRLRNLKKKQSVNGCAALKSNQ